MFDTCIKARTDKHSGSVCILSNVSSYKTIFSGLPKMNNCPAEAIRLKTSVYTNVAVVKQSATGLEAYDFDNNKLLVA
jgi:hypothetical protein